MANFCGHCGTGNEGGTFCGSCGQPLDVAPASPEQAPLDDANATVRRAALPEDVTPSDSASAPPPPAPPAAPAPAAPAPPAPAPPAPAPPAPAPPTSQPPPPMASQLAPAQPQQVWQQAAPQPSQPGYQQGYQQGYPPQTYPPQPSRPKVNPFQGWPVSDYLRDAGAAFCLFACLGMPWDLDDSFEFFNHGGERWWVVISALLAVVSLVVPYLAKAGTVPTWSRAHYRLTKYALNAPLALSVLAALVVELVNINDDLAGGLGSGIGMALAGVALAVQPRQAEEEPANADDRLWNTVARITTISAVALTVILFITWLLHAVAGDGDSLFGSIDLFDPFTAFLTTLVAALVMPLVVIGWPAFNTVAGRGSAAWRRVLAVSGFSVIVIALFALAADGDGLFYWPQVEKWNGVFGGGLPGAGVLLVGAAAAFAVSRSQVRATATLAHPVDGWLETLRAVLLVSAAGSGVFAVSMILSMITDDFESGPIVITVLALVSGGAAGFGLSLLPDPRRNRVLLLAILAGIVVVGFILLGVVNGEDVGFAWINNGWTVAAWISLPTLGAYALVGPREVRAAFGPLVTPSPAPANPQSPPVGPYGQPGQPGQQGQPGPAPYGTQPGHQQPPPQQPGGWGPPPQ